MAQHGMTVSDASCDHNHPHAKDERGPESALRVAIQVVQKYAVPLVSGVLLALLWANVDEHSYHGFLDASLTGGVELAGHDITLHFLVNDIFMCFFFGLAIKEVTSSLLPGGALSPLRKAINPLMATAGGVCGPVIAYIASVMILYAVGAFDSYQCQVSHYGDAAGRRLKGALAAVPADPHGAMAVDAGEMERCSLATLLNGWGVPTATDISLAWMFAALIFGNGHPAVNFLLLLAIVDDAIGMVIIAICYPDPEQPVEPVYLLLVLVAMVLALGMRFLRVPCWSPYIIICGPFAWLGLIKAHVHPALALCFVIPFMPSTHPLHGASGAHEIEDVHAKKPASKAEKSTREAASEWMAHYSDHHAPLDAFEHNLKLPVDIGMFLFGLSNAGVQLNTVGTLTVSVLFALIVGKTLGIACFALLASKLGFPLPAGVTTVDLFAMGAVGGIGLTVALFVANEAFVDPGLQGQAKFAAVLSVLSAGVAWSIRRFGQGKRGEAELQPAEAPQLALSGVGKEVGGISNRELPQLAPALVGKEAGDINADEILITLRAEPCDGADYASSRPKLAAQSPPRKQPEAPKNPLRQLLWLGMGCFRVSASP